MPRPALTDAQRAATRNKIRRAAAELYARNGLTDISARAVARTAGVSIGTLYSYFDNLADLMRSLWKEPVARFLDELDEISAAATEPRARLREVLEAYVRFAIDHYGVYRGAFLFVRPASHDKPVPVALGEDRLFSILRHAVEEGQREGVFRKGDATEIAQSLWAALHGSIALPTNIDRLALEAHDRLAPRMVELLLEWIEA